MAISKLALSASTNGRGVPVTATSSPGTTIHTGSSSSSDIDEVWLYISNPDIAEHAVTIQWGGTTSLDDSIVINIPPYQGLSLVTPGFILNGNSTPLIIRAFADTASKVSIHGYVNRITP